MSIKEVIKKAKSEGRLVLTETEAKGILKQAGINVVETELAATKEEAIAISEKLGLPVALKIVSPDIIHKSDSGGVKLGLKTKAQVGKAYSEIIKNIKKQYPKADIHGVSVQKMARPGVEVIIGVSTDAQFGPVVMFGLGGVLVEILKDVAFRIVPLEKKDAREMIKEIKGYPVLEGYRGQEAVNINKLEDMILKISKFVEKNPQVKELDLNPVFAYSDGAVAVDARIILGESD